MAGTAYGGTGHGRILGTAAKLQGYRNQACSDTFLRRDAQAQPLPHCDKRRDG